MSLARDAELQAMYEREHPAHAPEPEPELTEQYGIGCTPLEALRISHYDRMLGTILKDLTLVRATWMVDAHALPKMEPYPKVQMTLSGTSSPEPSVLKLTPYKHTPARPKEEVPYGTMAYDDKGFNYRWNGRRWVNAGSSAPLRESDEGSD